MNSSISTHAQIANQLNIFDGHSDAFNVNNVIGDWDGLIYTFCYKSKDNIVNGFIPEYCIESWGKINTVMLMEMFEDYNYTITCRPHQLHPTK